MPAFNILMETTDLSVVFLSRTLPFMVIGVIFAELIVALKFVDKVAFIAKPLTNFAHLSEKCGASFMTAFVSPMSANSMLASYYNNGVIERGELFIASMMNTFPGIVMHWRSMLPVLIPLLGFVGIIYFCILMLIGLIKTLLVMVAGRFLLAKKTSYSLNEITVRGVSEAYTHPNPHNVSSRSGQLHPPTHHGEDSEASNVSEASNPGERPPLKSALKISLQNSKRTVKRIVVMTIPTTFIVFTLYAVGVFGILTSHLSGISTYFPIPPEGLSIVAAQFGHSIAAATVAGNVLSAGTLTGKDIILTLLVGNVLTSLVKTTKHLTPYYVGIFGPKNGTQIMALSTTVRTGIVLVVIFVLALFW